jgi:hypothetical protein
MARRGLGIVQARARLRSLKRSRSNRCGGCAALPRGRSSAPGTRCCCRVWCRPYAPTYPPVVVDRKTFARPNHGGVRAGPALDDVLGDFVDRHDRAAVLVVAGDDPADCEAHGVGGRAKKCCNRRLWGRPSFGSFRTTRLASMGSGSRPPAGTPGFRPRRLPSAPVAIGWLGGAIGRRDMADGHDALTWVGCWRPCKRGLSIKMGARGATLRPG